MLKQQVAVYRETLKDAMDATRGHITEKQRDANRELGPRLTQAMERAYHLCVAESGKGSFMRMKGHMLEHAEQQKQTMFDECFNHIKTVLKELLNEVKEGLLEKVDTIYVAVEREYSSVVLGHGSNTSAAGLPREQRAMRKNVLEIVDGAELIFKRAVGLEPEPEPEPVPKSESEPDIEVGGVVEAAGDGQEHVDGFVAASGPEAPETCIPGANDSSTAIKQEAPQDLRTMDNIAPEPNVEPSATVEADDAMKVEVKGEV